MVFLLIPIILLLWLYLMMPNPKKRSLGRLAGVDYAHRGLWNEQYPENSLPAFVNAAEHGFGVELDVHLTRDDQLAVLHDDDLSRLCPDAPAGLRVCDCTLAELKQYHLLNTGHTIPSFHEVLQAMDGRCPMIVELKTGPHNPILCERAYEALRAGSRGAPWCIESFDPRIVLHFRRHHPGVLRGQLAYRPNLHRPGKLLLRDLMFRTLICNVLSRPDFIAWDQQCSTVAFRLVKALFKPHTAAWTVRDEARMEQLRDIYTLQIFERFIPKR